MTVIKPLIVDAPPPDDVRIYDASKCLPAIYHEEGDDPEEQRSERVLVYTSDPRAWFIGFYNHKASAWVAEFSRIILPVVGDHCEVTHWTFLPQEPEDE